MRFDNRKKAAVGALRNPRLRPVFLVPAAVIATIRMLSSASNAALSRQQRSVRIARRIYPPVLSSATSAGRKFSLIGVELRFSPHVESVDASTPGSHHRHGVCHSFGHWPRDVLERTSCWRQRRSSHRGL